jgi:alanine-glyoxylate transaminase/serine-glyoxylate transaminase/serine-pyruvate transaminase
MNLVRSNIELLSRDGGTERAIEVKETAMVPELNWGRAQGRPILMVPGPTEIPFRVMQVLAQPPQVQYDLRFDEDVLEPLTLALRGIFQTANEVIMLPGSGRTGLEAAAVSLIEPGDPVLVVTAGVFGTLMRDIMERVGAKVTEFAVEWGQPMDLDRLAREAKRLRPRAITLAHNETSTGTTYPAGEVARIARDVGALYLLDSVSSLAGIDVPTDEWGVDLNMTGSQKCLAAPLGFAIVSVSPAAWEVMERRKRKSNSYAYDLLGWKHWWMPRSRGGLVDDGGFRWQPVSIPSNLTAAMQAAVGLILEEGLPHRIRRHAVAARAFRRGVEAMGLEMFPHRRVLSDTVSCVRAPAGIVPGDVVRRMRDQYGVFIGTGLGAIRSSTLRVGTMGVTASPHYVLPTLSALDLALRDLGYKSEPGAGVAAAQSAFADAAGACVKPVSR